MLLWFDIQVHRLDSIHNSIHNSIYSLKDGKTFLTVHPVLNSFMRKVQKLFHIS